MTDSTSIGLALRYSGLKLTASDDVLTTNHDHYAVEAALLVCAERTGCAIKRIDMYRDVVTGSMSGCKRLPRSTSTAHT
jgi:isopenicillin-N epimerase